MRYLVDSGIMIRFTNVDDPLHQTVRSFITAARRSGIDLFTSCQNVAEFWCVCTRPAEARGGVGLTNKEAAKQLLELEFIFEVLPEPPYLYDVWKSLIHRHGVRGRQVHDARVAAFAIAHGIGHLATLNSTDFNRFADQLTVVVPGK